MEIIRYDVRWFLQSRKKGDGVRQVDSQEKVSPINYNIAAFVLFQIKCTWKCLAGIINGDVALMLIESLFAEADKKGSRLLRGAQGLNHTFHTIQNTA